MTYQHKFYGALGLAFASSLAIIDSAVKLLGSFGAPEIVVPAGWQLALSAVVFATSAPLAYYYNARRKTPAPKEEYEVQALLELEKNNQNNHKNQTQHSRRRSL